MSCGKQFQSKRRKQKLQNKLWREYVHGKQTAKQLGHKYSKSRQWVSNQLSKVDINQYNEISPGPIVVVADTVFWGREYGITIFREPNLKKYLVWKEAHTETPGHYEHLKLILEQQGFDIQAVVLDGKRGVKEVFSGIPVQMCHFHQIAIVKRYLTSRPKLPANIELWHVALTLTKVDEKEFISALDSWYQKWRLFFKERTTNPFTGRWHYTHKRLRSAYRSLKSNLLYLFTYQRYPELHIPNTTNSLDGSFNALKTLLRSHQGIRQVNRYKIICEIFKNHPPKN